MRIYMVLIILLSFIYTFKTNDEVKDHATIRLRVTTRGFKLHRLPKQPAHASDDVQTPTSPTKEPWYPVTRLRFAASLTKQRVFVSTSPTAKHTGIKSLVRAYVHDLVSIPHLTTITFTH
jgi:hypothetical protein